MVRHANNLLVFLSLATSSVCWSSGNEDSSRPRGVGHEFAKYYTDTSTFTCISHPSIQIPFSAVNDDYCDCPDGSDEPGTAACSHISRLSPHSPSDQQPGTNITPALPGFYCKNKGHKPAYLPFLRVNDGVCDYDVCCDGSDEWAHVGGTKCEDRCKEIGKEWRKNEDERVKSLNRAVQKRKELVAKAAELRKEAEDELRELEKDVEEAETKVANLETELGEVQKRERGKVIKGQKKGRVSMLAGLAKNRVEELRTALVDTRAQRDRSRERAAELESILSTFQHEYNPNFNDEGVKRAVRSWEEYAARTSGEDDGDPARDRDLDSITKPDNEESGINWQDWENEEDTDVDVTFIYQIMAYLPPSFLNFIDNKVDAVKSFLISNGVIADPEKESSSDEPKPVADARKAVKNAKSDVNSARSRLTNQQSDLEKDYGPDSVFRALKDTCITRDSGEYTYELCWFKETKQKSKKGGSDSKMGKYVRFGTITTDELSSAGEIVAVEKMTLEYENGQKCWNGPARSTTVIMECGENDELLKVTEDEKCVYSMHVATPAVCGENASEKGEEKPEKDEL